MASLIGSRLTGSALPLDDNRRSNRGPAGISPVLPAGILARLRAVRDNLAPVGQETIDYILANQRDVIRMSITELADRLQISEGSVVRVCKQIGMKGFADLGSTVEEVQMCYHSRYGLSNHRPAGYERE